MSNIMSSPVIKTKKMTLRVATHVVQAAITANIGQTVYFDLKIE